MDGLVLLCLGDKETEATDGPDLGTSMFWSHFDSREYLEMLTATGFRVVYSHIEPDPISTIATHPFVLARKHGAQQLARPCENSVARGSSGPVL